MDNMNELPERLAAYEKENRELRLRVEELTDFFENASLPLHRVNGSGEVIWANQAELDLLGYTKEEYVGRLITDFHADNDIIEDILDRLTNNETLLNYPARLRSKNGSIKHVLINSNVLMKDGEFIHTRCFTRDITDLKNEEERKNTFISMVSHELKTPLTSIKSYVQILLSKAAKEKDDFRINVLTRTDAQVKKMVKMIEDFLNLSRLEDGKIQLNKESFDLYPLVREVVDDVKVLLSSHTISLQGCNVSIYADKEKMGHVLTNLLSNAIKYSPPGGKVTLGCEKNNKSVRIFVKDEGIGINAKAQKHIFGRFYRVEDEKTKNVSGFGMGLYLVAELLRYHNSQIDVESEEGRGSTFYFTLPVG
jgi:PAS domain S-box-containing protein